MKKTILVILVMMAVLAGFSQKPTKMHKGPRTVKSYTAAVSTPTQTAVSSSPTTSASLDTNSKIHVVYGRVENGDTLLIVYLPEVDIDLLNRYYEFADTRQGRRLVSNVRKVYPYAKTAALKLQEFDSIIANTDSGSERRQMLKDAEDQLTDQYTEELKHLNFTQGAILIRLIDRQTGNTSYKLVQELRGKLRAAFYQGFARLWGYNLKAEFDPVNNKEDEQIDIIATLLDRGQI